MASGLEPTPKSPAMARFLEANFGRSSAINELKCIPAPVGCGRQLLPSEVECWDQLTIKEYRISGLCKTCQDSIFESDEDDDEGPGLDGLHDPDPSFPDSLLQRGEEWPGAYPTDDQ
jgi:hypothetical protein